MISLHDDVLSALRDATASQHTVLDQAMPLARAAPSLSDYHVHLRLLRDWLAGIAHGASHHDDGPQDTSLLPPVDRLRLIDADLAEQDGVRGAAEATGAIKAVEVVEAAGLDGSAAWRWGVAYVVEGSQLGGLVLHRRLAAQASVSTMFCRAWRHWATKSS
eukprot:gene39317-48576_t